MLITTSIEIISPPPDGEGLCFLLFNLKNFALQHV